MKRKFTVILLVLAVLAATFALTACADDKKPEEGNDPVAIHVVVPDGAPALAIAKLLKDKPTFEGYNVTYEIVAGAAEIGTKLTQGGAQIAVAPTNIAATLYNKKKEIALLASAVHGLVYMVGTGDAETLSDLKGNVVYNIGQGGTPDLSFQYILRQNGIEYVVSDQPVEGKVALSYVGSGTELIPLIVQGKAQYGILGEPAATQALGKLAAKGGRRLFDLQQLWNEATGSTENYPQASVVVNKSLLTEAHSAFINRFLQLLEENASWILTNPSEAGQALVDNGSLTPNSYNAEVIARCNIRIVKASQAKTAVERYLNVLYGFNPQSIGGSVPDAAFYAAI